MNNYTRKLIKNNRGSYYLNIPKELVKELKLKDKQKLSLRRRGEGVLVEDWEG